MAPKHKDKVKGKKHDDGSSRQAAHSSASSSPGSARYNTIPGAQPKKFSQEEIEAFRDENDFLGEGSYAKVHGGYLDGATSIAIKDFCDVSQKVVEQYEAEKKNLIKFQHERLVKLIGFADADNDNDQPPKLVIERMNETLSNVYQDLDWQQILRILKDVATAIHYFHTHSEGPFILTDLKPANILLDKAKRAKICDLAGVTKVDKFTLTYTKEYEAPENKNGKACKRSDIYSFGVMMFELVTRSDCLMGKERKLGERYDPSIHGRIAERARHSEKACKPHKELKKKGLDDASEASLKELAMICTIHNNNGRATIEAVIERLTALISMTDCSSSSSSSKSSKSRGRRN